jgi:hypothetical protein
MKRKEKHLCALPVRIRSRTTETLQPRSIGGRCGCYGHVYAVENLIIHKKYYEDKLKR